MFRPAKLFAVGLLICLSISPALAAYTYTNTYTRTYTYTNINTNTMTLTNTINNTYTQTCTHNGVRIDCDTREALSSTPSERYPLCPERIYEAIYGYFCDHRVKNLEYLAVRIRQGYGDTNFAAGTPMYATAMNDNNDVVGSARTRAGDVHAVKTNVGPRYPDTHYFSNFGLPGMTTNAMAINNLGTIVGDAQSSLNDPALHETIWHSQLGGLRQLDVLGGHGGTAVDVARNRMYREYVTGYAVSPADGLDHGFLWMFDGRFEKSLTIGGAGAASWPSAVNDSAIVVGSAAKDGSEKAFYWNWGYFSWLDVPGEESHARDLNNNAAAVIVGEFSKSGKTSAFRWAQGVLRVLPSLDGAADSAALAVTDAGDIVGRSGGHAVIWRDGEVYDLNERLAKDLGVQLVEAIDINRQGRILVRGDDGNSYVLIPTESFQ